MSFGPYLRTPFTDLTGSLVNYQNSRCAEMEMAMMDCLEAYGTERGVKKCAVLIEDFRECASRKKQIQRAQTMRLERHRQYLMGERKKADHYADPPKMDSY